MMKEPKDMTVVDYGYCVDCNMFFDLWRYQYSAADAGHDDCNWRYVTEEELKDCIKGCREMGCFEDQE
jgi:hypothetical protein